MSTIKKLVAREILDSRGNPTVETKVILENGIEAKASVPSGASTGVHEAVELRDGDKKRYGGLGVLRAVENVNKVISGKIAGMEVSRQKEIDGAMLKADSTKDKSALGANAILSVSLACSRCAAAERGIPLYRSIKESFGFKSKGYSMPVPSFNIFNGGKHADTNLDFQEFMIIPVFGEAGKKDKKNAADFSTRLRAGAEIFHELGHVLKESGLDTDVGNEGGYAPDIVSSIQAIEFIMSAIIRAGYKPGEEIGIGIDVGSSELYSSTDKKYIFKLDNVRFSNSTLIGLYYEWFRKYPIISIEDGLAEDDWDGWKEFTAELGGEMMVIGDDLFVTNLERIKKGVEEKAANTVLIKPNQVGTLTETVDAIKFAQQSGYRIMVSHRSGETCDDFIADLAVGSGADFIKSGSLSRGERLAKYNRLLEIEDEIKSAK